MNEQLRRSIVRQSGSLEDAMRTLEVGATGIVLVLNDEDRLVGILTDGDIRRALLSGAGLNARLAPHMKREFTSVLPESTRNEVLDLMQARTFKQIPIVDQDGKLAGLHLLQEILGAVTRPNCAVVMAGGKGTRLYPLTENLPKPMIKVAGRPILERIVLHLVGYGIRKIYLSINYLGHVIEEHFGDGTKFGCQIEYLRETQPLGTGGALALLPQAPRHPILVMNGDLVTQFNAERLLQFHKRHGQVATMGVQRYFHKVPYGCLEVEGTLVKEMVEKPTTSFLVNAGIYVVDPQLLPRIPRGELFGLPKLLEDAIQRGEEVRAFELQDEWIDVGQKDQLHQARTGDPLPAPEELPVRTAV